MSLSFKQYHKGSKNQANKGPKVGLGQQKTNKIPNNRANKRQKYGQLCLFFYFLFYFSFLVFFLLQ
jgi:hypothetical protein